MVMVLPLGLPEVQTPAGLAVKVIGFPETPPVALTVNGASPYVLMESAAKLMVCVAWPTVNELVPLLARKLESPAKLAATPLFAPGLYVPTLIPDRLTLSSVATPLALVVALPALLPLSVKLMVLLFTPDPPEVRVAERVAVPP